MMNLENSINNNRSLGNGSSLDNNNPNVANNAWKPSHLRTRENLNDEEREMDAVTKKIPFIAE